jgi:hypothetical protein
VEQLLWDGDRDAALVFLDDHRWSRTGSVALERRRQDLLIQAGRRSALLTELEQWRSQLPESPDLLYLQARILEDPRGRLDAFQSLVRSYPQHSWSRIGLVATAQLLGRWQDAQRWLDVADPDDSSRFFYRVVTARQLVHDGLAEAAMSLLAADAFELHQEVALVEYQRHAAASGNLAEARRAGSELTLRRAGRQDLDTGTLIDLVFDRLLGEWPRIKDLPLEEILEQLDAWADLVDVPSGWAQVDSYRLGGVARMVRPETDLGGVSRAWADAGRYLLAGSAYGRGNELHLLQDVVVMRINWPRHESPIEMVAARGVASPQGHTAQGGTVFRGFYLLLDSLDRGATRTEQRLALLQKEPIPVRPELKNLGRLESNQLPNRLRLAAVAATGSSVHDLELLHLALHEAGHLGEILSWLDDGLPLASVTSHFLASELSFGSPLLWLEYRAQLRALASGWQPGWALAEIIERGQRPRDPYYKPYRRILLDLVQLAEQSGWPALADWDRQQPGHLVELARRLCARRGFAPSPDQGTDSVVRALVDFDLLEHPPGDRVLPVQFDQR